MKYSLYKEILSTRLWNIRRESGHAFAMSILDNPKLELHAADARPDSDEDGKSHSVFLIKGSDVSAYKNEHPLDFTSETNADKIALLASKVKVGDAERLERWGELELDDTVINYIPVTGPITRNGGGCSYGSMEIRDNLIKTTNIEQVVSHILYIDSPGGSSFARNDFKMGIDAVHASGKKVYGLIDGQCHSAALGLACLCDEVYYVDPNDTIGSVGTMAAFRTIKDGTEDSVSHSVYHERYSEDSYDKNLWARNAADGDYALIDEELKKDSEEFAALVKECRPKTPDDMLHGKDTTCAKAPYWVNGQSDLTGLIARIIDEHEMAKRKR